MLLPHLLGLKLYLGICNQTTEIFDPYRRQLLIDRGLSLGKVVHTVLSEYLAINGILKADGNRFKLGNIRERLMFCIDQPQNHTLVPSLR